MFPNLPNKLYSVIYCDPPWDYKGQKQHTGKGGVDSGGAVSHYPTVRLTDLKELPVWEIAEDNCLLFMWTSSPHLPQAIELGNSWGFNYATISFVWYKEKTNPGFYTMSSCEICLVFKRGKIPQPRGSRNERQFLSELRTKHSAKPSEIRNRVGRMFPEQNKIELFARENTVEDWDCWGNDV